MSYPTSFDLTPTSPQRSSANRFTTFVRACGAYIGPYRYHELPTKLPDQNSENTMIIWGDPAVTPYYSISEYYKHSTFHFQFIGYDSIELKAELVLYIELKSHKSTVDDSKVEIFQGATQLKTIEGDSFWLIRNGSEVIPLEFTCPRGGKRIDIIIRPITVHPIGLVKVSGFILP